MSEFSPLGMSHFLTTAITVALIIFLPYFFIDKSNKSKNILIISLISLMLINHAMDFYYEGYLIDIKLGLPLHLCDFSSAAIMLYFLTKKREFFLFAFFAGISGAGMAILTPDTQYGFPNIHYIRHMIGHAMILLGVSYAIIIDNQRPYLKDVHRVLMVFIRTSGKLLVCCGKTTWIKCNRFYARCTISYDRCIHSCSNRMLLDIFSIFD